MKTLFSRLLKLLPVILTAELLFFAGVSGQTTYNVTSSQNWSSISISPSANDIINVSNGAVLTVDVANAVCATLTINNSASNSTSTVLISEENTLIVSGDVSINSGASEEKSLLNVFGTLAINGNLSIDNNSRSTLNLGGESLLTIKGSFSKGANGIFTSGTASTVNFNGSGDQTIPALKYNHLIISGERTINDVTLAIGEIKVTGDFEVTATFTSGGYITTGNTVILALTGASTLQTISGTPSFNNLTINSTGDKNFGSSTVTIAGTFLSTAGKMDGGSSTFIFTGSSGSIEGKSAKYFYHLNINNGAMLTTTEKAGTVNISGNFINNGTYAPNIVSTTNFKGGIIQYISGGGSTNFGLFEVGSSSTINSGTHNFFVRGSSFNAAGSSTFNGENNIVTFAGSVCVSGTGNINFNDLILGSSVQNSVTNKSVLLNSDLANVAENVTQSATINLSDNVENTVAAGTEVTINGNLTIENGSLLTLETSATSTGSLKVNGSALGDGTVNIQCYIPDELSGDDWHIISSPIYSLSLAAFAENNEVNATTTDYDLAPYDENAQSWNPYLLLTDDGSFEAGRGYAIRRKLNLTNNYVTFSGTTNDLTTGDKTGLISISQDKNGWNAVGNPYTTAIYINPFILANTTKLANYPYKNVYLWNPENSQYVGTSSGYAAIGQGFMVKSKSGGATIDFTKAMQSHQDVPVKSSEIPWPAIHLLVNAEGLSDKTTLVFNDTMSYGLDSWYDIGKFKGNPDIALYTQMPDDPQYDLQDQALPDLSLKFCSIPVGLDFKPGGTVAFTVETESFPYESLIYLEDKENGSMTLFNDAQSSYSTFITAGNKGTGRFYLVIANNTQTQISKINNPLFTSSVQNKTITIHGPSTIGTQIEIYGIDGKCWYRNYVKNLNRNRIYGSVFPDGVYILRIKYGANIYTEKLLLIEN